MTLSMYQASVPVFVRQFETMSGVLKKGEAFATARGIDPKDLLDARLIEDMRPLTSQIQIATDAAKGCVARLGSVDVPSFPDIETSFAELYDRIERVSAFIKSVPAEAIDGSEDKPIVVKLPSQELTFTGQQFLLHFALPNFFFHTTMTYAILRMKGVEIGKRDFLGGI